MPASSQREQAILVTCGILPKTYQNPLNFMYDLIDHNYSFFSTLMHRQGLREMQNRLGSSYGEKLSLIETSGFPGSRLLLLVAYAPEHFQEAAALPVLIQDVRSAAEYAHRQSYLFGSDQC